MANVESESDSEEFELDLPPDAENESDLPGATRGAVSTTSVQDTDWTAETILLQLKKGNIQLNPRFQRRDAWDDERKSKFIESLLLGLPIPQIVLAESPERKGKFIVIDGKQRLLALQRFAGADALQEPLRLKGLTLLTELNGSTFLDIEGKPELQKFISAFENQTIRTTVIRNWRSEDVLYTIFYRLNSGSLPLSPQELRHVLHPGPFVDFAFEFTDSSREIASLFRGGTGPDFRMRDVELLIRYLGLRFFLDHYSGDLKKFLDFTSQELNKGWWSAAEPHESTWEALVHLESRHLETAIKCTREIFGSSNAFRKYGDSGYESRFNRAVFDVMTFYFGNPELAKSALDKRKEVRAAYEQLSAGNPTFTRSLETTTKSISATLGRLHIWGEALQLVLGCAIPELKRAQQLATSTITRR